MVCFLGVGDGEAATRVGEAQNDDMAERFLDIGCECLAERPVEHVISGRVAGKGEGQVQNVDARI